MRIQPKQTTRMLPAIARAAAIEALEDRQLLSTYLVTSLGDTVGVITPTGAGNYNASTLRAAINAANGHVGTDTVKFAVNGTINLNSALPAVSDNLILTGPGLSKLTVQRSATAATNFSVFGISPGKTVDIAGITISKGTGTLYVRDGYPRLGGGIYNQGSLSVRECSVSNNVGFLNGGGIYNDSGAHLTLINSTISGNSADSVGGLANRGSVTATGCTFSGNSAGGTVGTGAGIENGFGTATLRNCTIAGNTATYGGAGIYVAYGTVRLESCTVAGNTVTRNASDLGAAGIVMDPFNVSVFLSNSIVAGNTRQVGTAAVPSDIFGFETDVNPGSSYNLIGTGGAGGLVNGVNGNKVGFNAKLGPLQFNGGMTKTMAPLAGSPVIDAGDPNFNMIIPGSLSLLLDQRGFTRLTDGNGDFIGRVDIGAVESAGKIVVAKAANGSATSLTNKDISLRYAIQIANTGPAADTIVFAPNVRGTLFTPNSLPFGISSDITIDGPGSNLLSLDGGAISRVFDVNLGKVSINGLTITNGQSKDGGGLMNLANLTLNNVVVYNNFATNNGAGIYNKGTLNLNNTTVRSNFAVQDACGIYNAGTLNLTGGAITGNGTYSMRTGGLYNSGTATLTRTSIDHNLSLGVGGITNVGKMTIVSSTIDSNGSNTHGGISNSGTLSLVGSTVSNNKGGFGAGGVWNSKTLSAANCTFSGNIGGNGGAIEGHTGSTTTLVNVTIAGNRAEADSGEGFGGGLLVDATAKVVARNTILSANLSYTHSGTKLTTKADDVRGKLDVTCAYNLIGTGGGIANGVNHNKVGVNNPNLGALASNGGPTKTRAVLTGSAALNAGSNALAVGTDGKLLTTDQRGFPRVVGGVVDIGAFEK